LIPLGGLAEEPTEEEEVEEEPSVVKGLSLPVKSVAAEPPREQAPAIEEKPGEAAPEPAEIPEWLRALRAKTSMEITEEPTSEPPTAEAEEAPSAEELPAAEPVPPKVAAEQAPDRLARLRRRPAAMPSAEEETLEEAMPDRSTQVQPPPPTPAAREPKPSEPQVPTWLKEPSPPPQAKAEPTRVETETPDVAFEELPDWLKPKPSPPAAPGAPPAEGIVPAEIPDWLTALRPTEAAPESEAALPVETAGLLAGIRGALPLDPLFAAPHTRPRQATQPPQVRLFADILAPTLPAAPTVAAKPRRRIALAGVARRLIYLALALAVIIPLAAPPNELTGITIAPSPAVAAFYDIVEKLPAGSIVLVAFDYDPSTSEEMDLQAKAIVHHLFQKNLNVLTISTVPEGAGLGPSLVDRVTRQYKGYQYGRHYLHLGFLPARETGLGDLVRNLVGMLKEDARDKKPLATFALWQKLSSLTDIALIIVLAGSQDSVKIWVEQVGAPSARPMVAGVTASAQPLVEPYRQAGQLKGLVSGLPGAAEYEIITNRPDRAVASLDAQSAAHLVLLIVLVLGNLAGLWAWLRRQSR